MLTTISHTDSPGALPVSKQGGSLTRMTDANLLFLSQAGDFEAAHCLIGRYRNVIDSVARRMASNPGDAADISSDVYLRVFDNLHSCRSAATLPGWIKKVAINVFCGLYRKTQRQRCGSLDYLMEVAGDTMMPAVEEHPGETPQGRLEKEERSMRVNRAVAALTPGHRQLIELFYAQERSYEEIVSITNLSLGTVKSRLFRAREAMQRKLGDLFA